MEGMEDGKGFVGRASTYSCSWWAYCCSPGTTAGSWEGLSTELSSGPPGLVCSGLLPCLQLLTRKLLQLSRFLSEAGLSQRKVMVQQCPSAPAS